MGDIPTPPAEGFALCTPPLGDYESHPYELCKGLRGEKAGLERANERWTYQTIPRESLNKSLMPLAERRFPLPQSSPVGEEARTLRQAQGERMGRDYSDDP